MALPPPPIEHVLPLAEVVIIAHVVSAATPKDPGGEVAGEQTVTLVVDEVLRGVIKPGDSLTAYKPKGAYALRSGVVGPWLLRKLSAERYEILGPYGPDTWTDATVREALR